MPCAVLMRLFLAAALVLPPLLPAGAQDATTPSAVTAPADEAAVPAPEDVDGPRLDATSREALEPAALDEVPAAVPARGREILSSPAPAVDAATLPHDLSPWGMFLAADIVVKAVMIGLAFASLVTWTVWLAKTLELSAAKLRARAALRRVEEAGSLAEAERLAGRRGGVPAALVSAAANEVMASADVVDVVSGEGLKERVASRLQRLEAGAGRRAARGTGLLATIGSTAPFVGLFGTVWGIMNSFIGISEAQTTNLAIVAPGIAEALLATAIGLVAAIPAVVIYNVFARSVTGYRALLADISAALSRHVSRDLDRRTLLPGAR